MMVAICQDTALFCDALAAVVTSRGHRVVCCVSTLGEAVRALERCPADVLLLAGSLTDAAPLARLRRQQGLRVLLLTDTGTDRSAAAAALEAGLADAMLDDAVALVTLERAVNGQLTPPSPSRPRPTVPPVRRTGSSLTARERDVIGLLLAGDSTVDIASALGVSRSTVHSHVQGILRKLGARSRVEAVSIYLGETTRQVG